MNNLEERFNKIKAQAASEITPQLNEVVAAKEEPQIPSTASLRNEIFSFVNPIELVDLPSSGKFYPEGHPLKDKLHVEIRQMTAKEEDILTNKSFIKKGIVIDKLIESLLVDKNIDVSSLLVGDKNAIMISARIAAYGPEYEVTLSCPSCGDSRTNQINLEEVKIADLEQEVQRIESLADLKHVRMSNGNIVIQLPKSKWFVECRLLNGKHERMLIDYLEKKRKKDPNAELELSEQLIVIIESINTIDETEKIFEAIKLMPAYDARFLRAKYQELIPNVSLKKTFSCGSCGNEQEVEVPFTQEFFWPK